MAKCEICKIKRKKMKENGIDIPIKHHCEFNVRMFRMDTCNYKYRLERVTPKAEREMKERRKKFKEFKKRIQKENPKKDLDDIKEYVKRRQRFNTKLKIKNRIIKARPIMKKVHGHQICSACNGEIDDVLDEADYTFLGINNDKYFKKHKKNKDAYLTHFSA